MKQEDVVLFFWLKKFKRRRKTVIPAALYLSRDPSCWPSWLVQDLALDERSGKAEEASRLRCNGRSASDPNPSCFPFY